MKSYLKHRWLLNKHIDMYVFDLEGKLEDVIAKIQDIPNRFKLMYPDLTFHDYRIDINHYHEDVDVTIIGYYWEPEEDFTKRMQQEMLLEKQKNEKAAKNIEKKEQQEKALYLKLKKKFENK